MVGQKHLQERFTTLIENGKFPRFVLLVGQRGGGKKLLVSQIAHELGAHLVRVEPKAESVREMIEQAYQIASPTLYCIADADAMSSSASNALLKVTEEPPRNAYFVMTLQEAENTLTTIRSRGALFNLDPYTPDELAEFIGSADAKAQLSTWICSVCATPADVMMLKDCGIRDFQAFVRKVVDCIASVPGCNSFKIANSINFTDATEAGKYDLKLFWRAFNAECMERLVINSNPDRYIAAIRVTESYLTELRKVALNKSFMFDSWLLDIRMEWMKHADA